MSSQTLTTPVLIISVIKDNYLHLFLYSPSLNVIVCDLTHSSQGAFDRKGAGLPETPRQLPLSQCQQRQTLHDNG